MAMFNNQMVVKNQLVWVAHSHLPWFTCPILSPCLLVTSHLLPWYPPKQKHYGKPWKDRTVHKTSIFWIGFYSSIISGCSTWKSWRNHTETCPDLSGPCTNAVLRNGGCGAHIFWGVENLLWPCVNSSSHTCVICMISYIMLYNVIYIIIYTV